MKNLFVFSMLLPLLAAGFSCAEQTGSAAAPPSPPAVREKETKQSAQKKAAQAVMAQLETVDYPCSFDKSVQKARCYFAKGDAPRPLLVALHTWGGSYKQDCSRCARYCIDNNWNFIFPNFRGPNRNPASCGSDAVVADIADAVSYMRQRTNVDNDRVYLIGGSGGGHVSLLMASRRPELWAAVSAWCPISDVAAWYDQGIARGRRDYPGHIVKICGGDPSKDASARADALKRSPLTYMKGAPGTCLDISTGIHDGHRFKSRTGSVPVSQSLNAFNALAKPADRLSPEDIAFITAEQKIPEKFGVPEPDPAFAKNPVLFRRTSGKVRISVFEGGHDILFETGLEWLARQKRGTAPDWSGGKALSKGAVELAK